MRYVYLMFALFLAACGAYPPAAQAPVQVVTNFVEIKDFDPLGDLGAFPIQPGQLSIKEMARLGLRPMALTEPWIGLNYYRQVKRVSLDTLPVGTIVLVDSVGTPRYKEDCGNLLVEITRCPRCFIMVSPVGPGVPGSIVGQGGVAGGAGAADPSGVSDARSAVDSSETSDFWASVGKGILGIFKLFLWILAALLALAVGLAVLFGLTRWLFGLFDRPWPLSTPPAPPVPAPPAPRVPLVTPMPRAVAPTYGRRRGEGERRRSSYGQTGFGRRDGEEDRRIGSNDRRDGDRRSGQARRG